MSFLFHLALSTGGAMLVVVLASVVLGELGADGKTTGLLTLGPLFPAPIIAGLSLGYLAGRNMSSRKVSWVWVVPMAALVVNLGFSFVQPHNRNEVWMNTFGPTSRCTSICLEQLFIAAPCLSSIAYTIGNKLQRSTAKK
jgi:hypothetical protein